MRNFWKTELTRWDKLIVLLASVGGAVALFGMLHFVLLIANVIGEVTGLVLS